MKQVVPRINKQDYGKLTQDEKAELTKTGKITGYTISQNPRTAGTHTLVEATQTKTQKPPRRNKVDLPGTGDNNVPDSDDDHKSMDDSVKETLNQLFWMIRPHCGMGRDKQKHSESDALRFGMT